MGDVSRLPHQELGLHDRNLAQTTIDMVLRNELHQKCLNCLPEIESFGGQKNTAELMQEMVDRGLLEGVSDDVKGAFKESMKKVTRVYTAQPTRQRQQKK